MKTIYRDSLITLTDEALALEHYYFPFGGRKVVSLGQIEEIRVEPATIWNGRWRIHGTGNFKTWFPRDLKRNRRDRIFFMKLKTQRTDIAFTVEDGDRVEKALKELKLVV